MKIINKTKIKFHQPIKQMYVNYGQNYPEIQILENNPEIQVLENNPEIQGNDNAAPIYKEISDYIKNNASTYSKDNYGFSTVFIIYLIQSVIYLLIHFYRNISFNP